jgi:hypothetical protein
MKRLLVLFLLLFASVSFAGSPGDYTSIYSYPITIGILSFSGYKNMYNLDNPVIRCGDPLSTCTMDTKYTQYARVTTELRNFKVFIPPGTQSLYTTVFCENSARYVAVARLGQPPAGSYTGGKADTDLSKLNTQAFTEAQLKAEDCIAASQEGMLSVAAGNCNTTEGRWLYVALTQISGKFTSITVGNIVSSEPYMKWFRAFDWSTFEDTGNVPASTPIPVAPPTPTPIPSGDCSWWYCTALQGGKCVNNVCVVGTVVSPTPTPTQTPVPVATPIPAPTPSASVIDLQVIPGQLYRFVVH